MVMPQPLQVLILGNGAPEAQLIITQLEQAGFETKWERVDTELEFLATLNSGWDVILAAYNPPRFEALQALRILQQRKCLVPLIVISGTLGEETAVAAMKAGAADYLLGDRLGHLGEAVTQALEQRLVHEAQRLAEATLLDRTQTTALTAGVSLALSSGDTLSDMLQQCARLW